MNKQIIKQTIREEINRILEAQTIPRVGDWYIDKDFNYHTIKRVNKKDKWIDIWRDDIRQMIRIDLWNVEYKGNRKGKAVWTGK